MRRVFTWAHKPARKCWTRWTCLTPRKSIVNISQVWIENQLWACEGVLTLSVFIWSGSWALRLKDVIVNCKLGLPTNEFIMWKSAKNVSFKSLHQLLILLWIRWRLLPRTTSSSQRNRKISIETFVKKDQLFSFYFELGCFLRQFLFIIHQTTRNV